MTQELIDFPLRFKVYVLLEDGRWTLQGAFTTDMVAGTFSLGIMAQGAQLKIFDGDRDVTEPLIASIMEALKADPAVQEMLKQRGAQL